MVKFSRRIRALGQMIGSSREPVDLNKILTMIHRGCMGLPQELVGCIMEMLQDDVQAIKACSLTCKSMFASTRHLIHQTLWLIPRNNETILTRDEKKKVHQQRWKYHYLELRFLSYMGERGFLRYARRVHIRGFDVFNPDILLHHFRHFLSLDQVQTLTIEHHNAFTWEHLHQNRFNHFYPTLTSITLIRPFGHYRLLLEFVLQFPRLESLAFERLKSDEWKRYGGPVVDQLPPLCGHLRLAFDRCARWPRELIRELGDGVKFRSVELESDYFWDHGHHLLAPCAQTLEDLTISTHGQAHVQLSHLKLIRRLTYRMPFHRARRIGPEVIFDVLFTITSPEFCELVLEITSLPPQLELLSSEELGYWEETDSFIEDRFASRGDFKFIVRTGDHHNLESFRECVREVFPLLAYRGCIHFETSHRIDASRC